jgi:hypothetical protein
VHLKYKAMAVVEITSRQFRESQKAMFELADKGEKLLSGGAGVCADAN